MKRRYIVSLLVIMVAFLACRERQSRQTSIEHEHAEPRYTCPMHPQIVQDKPGTCPICGMDLVPQQSLSGGSIDTSLISLVKPVDQQVVSGIATISPETGMRIFSEEVQGRVSYDRRNQVSISSRVAGRIERLFIRYNFQPVRKRQLIMQIYSPDLVAAQREFLYVYRNDRNETLLERGRQKLLLLGMTSAQIRQLINTGQPSYSIGVFSNADGYILEKSAENLSAGTRVSQVSAQGGMSGMGATPPATGGIAEPDFNANTPVLVREGQYVRAGESLFTVYEQGSLVIEFSFPQQLAAEIRPGMKMVYRSSARQGEVYAGVISLLEPVVSNTSGFAVARMYIQGRELPVGSLVTGNIPVLKNNGWWIPADAVWRLGDRAIVFRKKNNVFVPEEVSIGFASSGQVQVLTNVHGWQIAANASFLVDSESFIRSNNQTE